MSLDGLSIAYSVFANTIVLYLLDLERDGFRQGGIGSVGIDAITENGGNGTVGDFKVGHQKIVAGKVYGIQKDGRILGNTDFRDVPKVK